MKSIVNYFDEKYYDYVDKKGSSIYVDKIKLLEKASLCWKKEDKVKQQDLVELLQERARQERASTFILGKYRWNELRTGRPKPSHLTQKFIFYKYNVS